MPVSGLRFSIPPDLDTDELTCFKVMWPNTPHWRSVLAGLMYMVARGRSWDERTGSVIDARDAGMSLFDANVPLVYCDDTPAPIDTPEDRMAFSGAWCGDWWIDEDWSEFDMSCLPCPPIKIEGGKLYWFNCGQWVEIGPLTTVDETADDAPPTLPDVDPPVYTACAKATAIVDVVWTIIGAAWDVDADSWPTSWVSSVQNTVPYELKNTAVVNLILTTFQMDILSYEKSAVLSDSNKANLICRAIDHLSDGQGPVSEDEYLAMRATMRGYYGIDLWSRDMVDLAMIALGPGNVSKIAMTGAPSDFVGTCDCPGETLEFSTPTANGWYFGAEQPDVVITNDGAEGWKQGCITDNPSEDVFGAFWQVEITGDTTAQWACQNIAGGPCDGLGANLWSDSSQPSVTVNCAIGHVDALTEVLGPGRFVIAAGGFTGTLDPNSPNFAAGAAVAGEFQVGWNKAATLKIKKFRWLYNANSPSHGA